MKRRVVLVLLLLVAGAIVNVAVAWGCAVLSRTTGGEFVTDPPEARDRWDMSYWAFYFAESHGAQRVACWVYCPSPPSSPTIALDHRPVWPDHFPYRATRSWTEYDAADGRQFAPFPMQDARGWPCLSMWCELIETESHWKASLASGGIPLSSSAGYSGLPGAEIADFRALPLRPIWPGFAINTVFYALVLWLLFAFGGTPLALRRRRRIKRGLCPKCAYDLRGSEGTTACPECGAAIPQAR